MQSSTHSSQMKTVGPAISLRTSCWDLPQNEQYKVFFESLALLIAGSSPGVVPGVDRQDYAPEALKNKVVALMPKQSVHAVTSVMPAPGVIVEGSDPPAPLRLIRFRMVIQVLGHPKSGRPRHSNPFS